MELDDAMVAKRQSITNATIYERRNFQTNKEIPINRTFLSESDESNKPFLIKLIHNATNTIRFYFFPNLFHRCSNFISFQFGFVIR